MEHEPIEVTVLPDDPAQSVPEVTVLPTPLSYVEPIHRGLGATITSPEQVGEYFEAPLLKAGEMLWHKDIPTFGSSSNVDHVTYGAEAAASITINGDKLSPENLQIAQRLASGEIPTPGYQVTIESHPRAATSLERVVAFRVPMKAGISVEEIEERSVEFAHHFKPNKVINVDVPGEETTVIHVE